MNGMWTMAELTWMISSLSFGTVNDFSVNLYMFYSKQIWQIIKELNVMLIDNEHMLFFNNPYNHNEVLHYRVNMVKNS